LKTRENKGLMPTLIELSKLAQGKYICTFASDDVMPAGRLQTQAAYLEAHPETCACYGQVRRIFPDGTWEQNPDPRYRSAIPSVSFEDLFLLKKHLHGAVEMFRAEAFWAVGGYDPSAAFEDLSIALALLERYGSVPVLSDVFCFYRIHGGGLHVQNEKMFQGTLAILKAYEKHPLYSQAKARWKANRFSVFVLQNKWEAVRHFWQCASLTPLFAKQLLKLLVPRAFLPRLEA
jgi:alpha-1,3-rhamnosyltransferase